MPKLGMTMKEGTLAEWLVPDGADVAAGQAVFRLTTEKVDTEADSPGGGTLLHLVGPGTVVPSGQVVGWILAPGEARPEPVRGPDGVPAARAAGGPAPDAGAAGEGAGGAGGLGGGRRPPAGTGAVGPGRTRGGRVNASPLARRMAEADGIDLGLVTGTGPGGRIVAEDVRLAAASDGAAAAEGDGSGGPTGAKGDGSGGPAAAAGAATRTALSSMRKVIAGRMHASLQQSAQLTIGMEVGMEDAATLRDRLNAAWAPVHVTFTELVARAAVMALADHRLLNSSLEGDELVTYADVDLGVAVAVAGGLVVPVVRAAGNLTLRALSEQLATLADAAGRGALGPDDLQGSTFTVTSLGAQGVDFFTPIINPPNVAILGVGRVRPAVAFEDGRAVECRMLTLSLTFDHRAVDGVPAAEYLAAVKARLEQPLTLVS